jgi:hypothetical protein
MVNMKIKNWTKHQHFKDRKPPWIKLYRDILDDMDWHELDAKSAKVLVMLWLIASENDGELPPVKTLAFRLRMSEKDVISSCDSLSNWLIHDDIGVISERYQSDSVETERERERETETKKEREKEIQAPEGVSIQVWQDFKKSRKAKLTQTALDGIQREANKAGWTMEAALMECCARGWTGFKADWVVDKQARPQPAKQAKSFAQQEREAGWARWEEMTNRTHPDRIKAEQQSGQVIDITPRNLEIAQ